MAQSRMEKIGTIYERVTSLIKAGAMKEEAKPFWVDIYKAFPPKYEPRYDRPKSSAPIRQIFYPEDRLRARFHKEYKHFSLVNMVDNNAVSRTEQFLIIYRNLEKAGVPENELYDKAIKEFVSKFNAERSEREAKIDKTRSTEGSKNIVNVNHLLKEVMNEFKEDGGIKAKDSASEVTELSEEEKKKYRPIRLSMEKIVEIMEKNNKKQE